MKRLISLGILLVFVLAACTTQETVPASELPTQGPSMEPTPTRTPVRLSSAQRAAVTSLSKALSIPAEQIKIVSTDSVTWPDGCMGVQRMGMMCTQNVVPGFRIVLEVNTRQYEFHANVSGSVIVPVEAAQASNPAQDSAINQLATNLGIQAGGIKLISSASVEWPDSCLGVALEGVMCSQMIVPGYLIVLEAGGKQFKYHTDNDGSRIMPATLAMAWREEGGIAGICQSLTIYRSGEVYGLDCHTESGTRMGTLANVLQKDDRVKFYSLLDSFGAATIDLSDPNGVVDGMKRNADWFGSGGQQPDGPAKQAMFDLGQKIYHSLYP